MALDFEGVKARVPILSVAEGLTTLNRSLQGPCPKCGGEDRFYLGKSKKDPSWFICSHCHPKAGDVIELVAWHEGISQAEACRKLGGDTGEPYRPTRTEPMKPDPKPAEPPAWEDPEWQAKAREQVGKASANLTQQSEAGQYLASRGLKPETWEAFRLGSWLAKWPGIEGRRPSILLPHVDQVGNVSALKYRAFDDLAKGKGKRFTQAKGSQARLFGGHLLTGGGESRTLILLEGEMNAAAAWQASRGPGWDVLSIGAEKPRGELVEELAELAKSGAYLRCLVWMDQIDRARAIGEAIRGAVERSCLVGSYQSQTDQASGLKWDAAELLKRGGGEYLQGALNAIFAKAFPADQANTPVLAPVRSIGPSETLKPLAPENDGAMDGAKLGASKPGDYEGGSPRKVEGLIYGPPEPRASADPLTPAELSTLDTDGRTEETIKDALDMAYRPRRGSPLGAAILGGCRAIEDGLGAYDSWLSGFAGDDEG